MGLFFDDFSVGDTFRSVGDGIDVSVDMITEFASRYDPQPFHLDGEAATATFFGRLVASGWHTSALAARLMVDSTLDIDGGIVGMGIDHMRWPRPVLPGDRLSMHMEVLGVTASNRRDRGYLKIRMDTSNQNGKLVHTMVANLVAPRRAQAA